ncbi:hypothetical protein A374_15778 [Fictibacillus macauensis ZFHKF-1]|uniref:DinB family protein n=1 Tax=Fictibacillus macauensis ZFHKF-1 TaxID=1196324 RepID=I8UBE2_9BACL|nr:DinB family protein [Fictibacillus macauensis]EIT84260.1 hypothetical protein A374_15778 [Fictibacillus macauensis ZFHKF-1]
MYCTISDFIQEWNREASLTQAVLDRLTDESLTQRVDHEGRTLGEIAWHFTTNIPEYLQHFGVRMSADYLGKKVPASAKEIAHVFTEISQGASEAIAEQWNDVSLQEVQNAFGRQETNATIFFGLIKHIVHHRGQVTVLMRQAGVVPFGVYGPTREGVSS